MVSELTIAPDRIGSPMAVPVLVARTLRRLLLIGAAIVALTWVAGLALESARFGTDLDSARARLENEVAAQFVALGAQLERAVRAVTVDPQTLHLAEQKDNGATRLLFDRVAAAAVAAGPDEVAITIYSSTNTPLAWNRGSVDVPAARLAGPASLFLGPSARGLQLVRIEPLVDTADTRRHLGHRRHHAAVLRGAGDRRAGVLSGNQHRAGHRASGVRSRRRRESRVIHRT